MSTQPLTQIPPTLTLSGTNIVLRSPSLSDAATMREIFSDLTTMQHLRFLTHESRGGWTLAEMTARLERQIAKQLNNEALVMHIHFIDWATGTETLVGATGFTEVDMENLNAHCGIVLFHSYWSRGLATEAFYLVLRYAFETLGLHRVIFETTEKNEGMRGWLEKVAGVQVEGIRREELRVLGKWVDSWCYAIFEGDWRDKIRAELERRMAKKNGEELESVLERMNSNW